MITKRKQRREIVEEDLRGIIQERSNNRNMIVFLRVKTTSNADFHLNQNQLYQARFLLWTKDKIGYIYLKWIKQNLSLPKKEANKHRGRHHFQQTQMKWMAAKTNKEREREREREANLSMVIYVVRLEHQSWTNFLNWIVIASREKTAMEMAQEE